MPRPDLRGGLQYDVEDNADHITRIVQQNGDGHYITAGYWDDVAGLMTIRNATAAERGSESQQQRDRLADHMELRGISISMEPGDIDEQMQLTRQRYRDSDNNSNGGADY